MESYRTEEEQVEALRKWWDENGRSTLAAVVLALAAGFGWQGWQEYRQSQAEAASVAYEELLDAVRAGTSSENAATVKTLAERLKSNYGSTAYAQFAALHLARVAVADQDLAEAEEELRWVLTHNPDHELRLVAELRLARVKAAQGNAEEALAIIQAADPGAYEPAYLEVEGDIYSQLGDTDKAISAYERALSLAAAGNIGAGEGLRLKLRALNPIPAREVAAVEDNPMAEE